MQLPHALLCATLLAVLIAASGAEAQSFGNHGNYALGPYVATREPLIPADPLRSCEFNRPPAVVGTFAFDFLCLQRNDVDSLNLVTVDGVDVLNAADFNFDETGAFRFTATLASPCGVDLQFSYLGSGDFSTTRTFTGTNVQDYFYGLLGSQTELAISYEAPLDSFEVNLRTRQWERFAPLAGFRFVSLNESATQVDVTNNLSFWGDTKNSLFGFQFGGQWLLARAGRWRLESVLKGGVYLNDMHVQGRAEAVDFDRTFSGTSFLGEASLMGVYEISPHASFRIGYQGLWLERAALLFDQYDNFQAPTGNGSVDLGSVNFQGGFAGFDLTW